MNARLVKIGELGNVGLEVERNGKFIPQLCPRQVDRAVCGDWCPMFEVNDGQDVQLKCAPRLVLLNLEVGQ